MATYRFRVTFEDYDDVTRDIEVRSTQTFEDFHYSIQNSIGFDASKPASFFLSDDNWKKGQEISTRTVQPEDADKVFPVKNSRLCDYIIDPHQKIYYVFDPSAPWSFRIELFKINREEDANATYPKCIKSSGDAPKQYSVTNIAAIPIPEDFDLGLEDETDEDVPEVEELAVDEGELPEGEEKDSFIKASDSEDAADDEFEPADGDPIDENADSDDF